MVFSCFVFGAAYPEWLTHDPALGFITIVNHIL
jgi:hypothetical protein